MPIIILNTRKLRKKSHWTIFRQKTALGNQLKQQVVVSVVMEATGASAKNATGFIDFY